MELKLKHVAQPNTYSETVGARNLGWIQTGFVMWVLVVPTDCGAFTSFGHSDSISHKPVPH